MASPTQPGSRLHEDFGWTARQREVLDLLARGRTNGQIAEDLGISLDGAKWHVSEVMSKLGVSSRDEAAEYWRAYNRWPLRFSRAVRGLVAGAAVRWAGVALAGVGVVAAGAGLLALRSGGNDGGSELPTTVASPTVVSTAPAASTPAPSVQGVSMLGLSLGEELALPRGFVVFYEAAAYATDWGLRTLWRAYTNESGDLVAEELLQRSGVPTEDFYTLAGDYQRGVIYAAACVTGICQSLDLPSADAQGDLYRSLDGGVTWSVVGSFGAGQYLVGVVGQEALVVNRRVGSEPPYSYSLFPAGAPLPSPVSSEFTQASVVPGIGLVWHGVSGRLYDSAGVIISRSAVSAGTSAQSILAVRKGTTYETWRGPGGLFIARDDRPTPYWWPSEFEFRPRVPVSDDAMLGNVLVASGEFHLAYLSFSSRSVRPIPGLPVGDVPPQVAALSPFLAGAAEGIVAEVAINGDCLDVRIEPTPSAESLGCYAGGVLLRDRGEEVVADGVTWLAVATPDGREGWADLAFLSR